MAIQPDHLEFLLEATNGASGAYNPQTDEARFSPRWMALLGLPPSDPAASRLSAWDHRCHPDDRHQLRAARQQIERGATDRYLVRLRMRHANGQWRVLEIRASAGAPNGQAAGRWLSAIAIDRRGQGDEEKRWRAIAEMSADWYWASDAEHRIVSFEAATQWRHPIGKSRFFGRRRDEFDGAVPGEGGWPAFHAVLDRHAPFKGLGYRLTADDKSSEVWVEIDGRPLFDADGCFCGYEGVGRDVSEARRATEARRRSLELVDSLFESIPVPVVMKDLQGRYVRVNRALCDLFGIERESVLDQYPSAVVDDDTARVHADADARLLDGRESHLQYEAHQVSASGRSIDTLVTKSVMKDAEGQAIGIVATVVDISTMKAVERELAEAKAAAEAASRAKSTFLSTMSHEIRTPMNAIIGMSYLALQGSLEHKQRRFIQTVHRSAEALLVIINDILDFSKIEAGQLDIEQTDFSLTDLMDDLAGLLTMRAHDKDLELIFDQSPQVPDRLIGDPVRLSQVLVNLVGNALKFTERGEVVIGIQRIEGDDRSALLRFEVRDTGIGMGPDVCERLFQPFVQADVSTSRKYGGTGLGLAISQRLVELMGGRIAVSSEPGQGSCFGFELRLGVRRDAPMVAAPQALRSQRLLVVDANASARQVLVGMARALGLHADAACDASQALQMLRQGDAQGQPFGVVLIDGKMPEADGVECLRAMSRTPFVHRPSSVLMVTAFEHEALLNFVWVTGHEG